MSVIAINKKANHDYQILEKFEAGLVLNGQEVKSIKTKSVSLAGTYISLQDNEFFWIGANIPAYQPENASSNYNPERKRKLLLKKIEIRHLIGKTKQKGLTLIPLKVYTKKGKIKIEFGIAKGLKKTDKREKLKKQDSEMDVRRILKENL